MRIFCATPRHRSPLWGGLVAIPPSGGRGSRNRTYNLRFWRPTLCQLSYTPTNQLRSEEHTSELQSHLNLVCRLLLEKKKKIIQTLLHIVSAQILHHMFCPTAASRWVP